MLRRNLQWLGFVVAAMVAVGCGPTETQDVAVLQQQLDTFQYYNGDCAAAYAYANYNKDGPSPFPFFKDAYGNGVNCANYGNQSILAGFVCSTDPTYVYNQRVNYQIDVGSPKEYKWYFKNSSSNAWESTSLLRRYAIQSATTVNGLHLDYVTQSTAASKLDVFAVRPGDIVLCDWENDWQDLESRSPPQRGFNHTMVVTGIDYMKSDEDRILLSAQTSRAQNKTLKKVKSEADSYYGTFSVYQVYRPTYYRVSSVGGGGGGGEEAPGSAAILVS